jgi:hypothetical protein
MAKTYFLVRNEVGARREWVTLFVTEDEHDAERGRRRAVPFCIGNECGSARHPVKNVALAILLDYLAGEEDCERKAVALAWAFARKLGGIGSGGKLLLRDKTSWSLTETQVGDMVTEILCDAKLVDFEAFAIEEVSGQRRDVIRAAAYAETVSDRMLRN